MKLRVRHDRILIQKGEPQAVKRGCIIVPRQWRRQAWDGLVLSVGSTVKKHVPELKEGMWVAFRPYAGTDIEWRGLHLKMVALDEMIGVIGQRDVDAIEVGS